MLNSIIEKITDNLVELKETLVDKASYYQIINTIAVIRGNLDEIFSKQDFELAIQDWRIDFDNENNGLLAEDVDVS